MRRSQRGRRNRTDDTLVNAAELVDEVTGGRGLAGVDMANDHDVQVELRKDGNRTLVCCRRLSLTSVTRENELAEFGDGRLQCTFSLPMVAELRLTCTQGSQRA